MSDDNDFIKSISGLMYSNTVFEDLQITEHRLNPLTKKDQPIGTLSNDEMRLWMLWLMAIEDLALENQTVLSLSSNLQDELSQSDEVAAEDIKARHKESLDEAQAQCIKAMNHELGIRCVLFGALTLKYGINPLGGDEVYQVRKGFVLVRVSADQDDSDAIQRVRDRAVATAMLVAFGRQA